MRVLDPKLFITIVEGVILRKNAKYGIFNESIIEKYWNEFTPPIIKTSNL